MVMGIDPVAGSALACGRLKLTDYYRNRVVGALGLLGKKPPTT
jgi:hypothetical protein